MPTTFGPHHLAQLQQQIQNERARNIWSTNFQTYVYTKIKLWDSKHLSKWTPWSVRAKMGCDPYILEDHKI